MAYIGVQPAEAYTSFAVQHFTTSATTSYTLDNAVANENEIALFINNVRQEPGSGYAYTAIGTALTLSAATSASDTMYCVFIGKAVQTVTPADNSITEAKIVDGAVGLNQLSATGTKDATTFLRGDNTFSTIETGTDWQSTIVTGATLSAVAGKGYWIDTTSNECTITFPSSASVGDTIELVDYARTWGTNKIIIDSNGLNYQGDPDTFTVEYDTSGQGLRVVYSGATKGWIPTSDEVSEDNPTNVYPVDFLVVAGGAGGGMDSGGGGGAGGYRASYNNESSGGGGSSESALTVTFGTQYTVTVGGGGAVSVGGSANRGGSGSNSAFGSITSLGGGGGGSNSESPDNRTGLSGGSGGGAGVNSNGGVFSGGSGTANQGRDGGDSSGAAYPNRKGGGGGGASTAGGDASTTVAGNGGNGVASTITGSSVTRAGGGGGGGQNGAGTPGSGGSGGGGAGSVNGVGTNGTANTGGGGGACSYNEVSGAGGSGIVILRMATDRYSGTTTGSPSVTTSGSDTILTYTGSGSYTA